MTDAPLLQVEGLKTYLFTRWGVVKAADDLSFSVRRGETLGLVGESGSGKSMTCLSLLRLLPKGGKIVGGRIRFDGEDVLDKSEREMRAFRGKRIAMVLQDPMTSLNPVFNIGSQVMEPIRLHQRIGRHAVVAKAIEALRLLRISSPEHRIRDYPHQMSGGMRQRVVGAIAMSCEPELLIADEPTTALDVTIQAQYLEVLQNIQKEREIGLIFVTHDLGIVAKMCHRVAVMYAGKIVETVPVAGLFDNPTHPYTRALLASVPRSDVKMERLPTVEGQPPALHMELPACPFAPRCPHADEKCRTEVPPNIEVARDHTVRCWKAANGAASTRH